MTANSLVTLVIVAYNQQEFVGAAIEGALAQTYSPLEIIISDDCSTDRTFERMQQAVAGYDGPHQVRVRRNGSNLGTFAHLMACFAESRGELLVCGAGDDISKPQRVQKLVEVWQRDKVQALTSAWTFISGSGAVIASCEQPTAPGNVVWKYFRQKHDRQFVAGQTSAYDRRFLQRLKDTKARIFHEDSLLTFLAYAWNVGVASVEEPLIEYRLHASYSRQATREDSFSGQKHHLQTIASFALANLAYLDYALDLLSEQPPWPDASCEVDLEFCDHLRRRLSIEAAWARHGLPARAMLALTNLGTPLRELALSRVLPLPLLAAARLGKAKLGH